MIMPHGIDIVGAPAAVERFHREASKPTPLAALELAVEARSMLTRAFAIFERHTGAKVEIVVRITPESRLDA